MMDHVDHETIAKNLLWPVWVGIPQDYKRKYARNIWQQYEDNIKSAAYTSNLRRFFDSLCQRLNVAIKPGDVKAVSDILSSGQDRTILRALRDDTTALVLLVRLQNEARKDAYEREAELNRELERPLAKGESPLYTEEEMQSLFGDLGGEE